MGCPQHAPNVFSPEDQLHPERDQFDPTTWTASVGTGDEEAVLERTTVAIVRHDKDPKTISITLGEDLLAGEILR